MLGLTAKTRIYQASTSELYGLVQEVPQEEGLASTVALFREELAQQLVRL